MTTDTTTQAVTALLDGVTPGPWRVEHKIGDQYMMAADGTSLMCDMTYYPWVPDDPRDWQFIAAARDLVPALLAERDALAAALAAAQAAHERIFAWGDGAEPIAGTWGLSRYPDNAVAYVREDLLAAAESRARESALQALAAYGQAAEAHEAQLAAEAKLATARAEALKEAARVAQERHSEWQRQGNACLVDDDISACQDIAAAIRALAKGGAT